MVLTNYYISYKVKKKNQKLLMLLGMTFQDFLNRLRICKKVVNFVNKKT